MKDGFYTTSTSSFHKETETVRLLVRRDERPLHNIRIGVHLHGALDLHVRQVGCTGERGEKIVYKMLPEFECSTDATGG